MAIKKEDFTAIPSTLIPKTSDDFEAVWKWKKGDVLYGTFAKDSPAWKRYRNDIENAPTAKDYEKKTIYINTFKPIGKQLQDVKK